MHPDQYIVEGIRNEDRKILKQLYRDYFELIKKMVLKNSGTLADAEDVFQESLVAIYSKLREQDIVLKRPFRGYLYAVARNLWLMQLRKKSYQKVTFQDIIQYNDSAEVMDKQLEKREQEALYHTKFKTLPADCQQVLTLFFEKKSMEEIAETMGYSNAGYAKKKKFLCKKCLIEMIREDALFKELDK